MVREGGSGPHCTKVGLLKRRIKILVFAFVSLNSRLLSSGDNAVKEGRGIGVGARTPVLFDRSDG